MPADFMFYWSVGLALATISAAFGLGVGMAHELYERSTTYVFDN